MFTSEEEESYSADCKNVPEFVPEQIDSKQRKRTIEDIFAHSELKLPKTEEIDLGTSTSSSLYQTQEKKRRSALFDGTFFSIQNIVNDNIKAKCVLCEPKTVSIKGTFSATSNFLKHIKVKHKGSIEKYQIYKKQVKEANSSDIRRNKETNSKEEAIPNVRQTSKVNQKEFDDKLTKFFVDTMIPLSIIENESFKALFATSGFTLMSKRNLVREIELEYDTFLSAIKHGISKTNYVCTTIDIWSNNQRSYIGVTCHWLDNNFKRVSVVLACRRFLGPHSFDKITEILQEMHLNFQLDNDKITVIVTDNGSNFTFQEYGVKMINYETNFDNIDTSVSENKTLHCESTNYIDNIKFVIPKHYKCASYTLNLLATTDVNEAIDSNSLLKTKHIKAFHMCSSLWEKAELEKSAEIIENTLGHTLNYPCKTRWNSLYNSIIQIISVKEKIPELLTKLDLIDSFKEIETEYLEEYIKVLKPIAETINFLQEEHNTLYGNLLPSIISLKVKLEKLIQCEARSETIYIIANFVLHALKERFSYFFTINEKSKDAIIAAAVIPSIKLRWLHILKETDSSANFKNIIDMIINETKNLCNFPNNTEENIPVPTSLQPDFFDFNYDQEPQPEHYKNDFQFDQSHKLRLQLLQYLEDKRCTTDMLYEYPAIKEIYLKYNSAIPSSAPVEKLFSFAGFIHSPKHYDFSDELFEKLVFLKGNYKFCT